MRSEQTLVIGSDEGMCLQMARYHLLANYLHDLGKEPLKAGEEVEAAAWEMEDDIGTEDAANAPTCSHSH
jgi:hypothetical protein